MEVEDPDAEGIENFAPAGTPAVREQHVCDARNLVDFAVVNPHTYYISVVNSHRGLVEMDVLHLVKKKLLSVDCSRIRGVIICMMRNTITQLMF